VPTKPEPPTKREKSDEYKRFERLTKRLLQIPKKELDQRRKKADG
jgi:hypothetical protein